MTDTNTIAHIPDEAVEVAFEAMNPMKSPSECCLYDVRKGLIAALPYLHAPCAVEVKKLEWDNASDPEAYLVSAAMVYDLGMLRYCILNNPDPDVKEYTAQGLKINSTIFHQHGFKTIEAAKAAAQADFERRILSCVVTKPVDAHTRIKEILSGERDGFINTGEEPHGNDADLSCPCCGGSGHKDDAALAHEGNKPIDLTVMAKSMLSIWDQWMNVEIIDRSIETQATDLLKAACFAGQAYEDMIASPLTADVAPSTLLRIFLIALIDQNSSELDPYRAKNRPQTATHADECTKPVDVAAVRNIAALNDINKFVDWFDRFICDQDELNSSTPRKVSQNAQDSSAGLKEAIRALSAEPAQAAYQERVKEWLFACFGEEISSDKLERCDRFIEEALELVQAIGYSAERAHALVDYVFNREAGEPHQEVGGVMVTLAGLCFANDLDMIKAGEEELGRVWTKVDKIRAKQEAKPVGSALPIPAAPTSESGK